MGQRQRNGNNDPTVLEKILSRSGVNIMTLFAICFSAGIFYNQNSSYHERTEERFKDFAESRTLQASQLTKLDDVQNKTLVELSGLIERMNAQTDVLKDMREILRSPPPEPRTK